MAFLLKSVDLVSGNRIDKKDFRKRYIKEVLKEDVEEDNWLYITYKSIFRAWSVSACTPVGFWSTSNRKKFLRFCSDTRWNLAFRVGRGLAIR